MENTLIDTYKELVEEIKSDNTGSLADERMIKTLSEEVAEMEAEKLEAA